MKLEGKVALVTGAGSGIGRAIALLFAKEGADIAVNDVDISSAEATAKAVKQIGQRTIAIRADVAKSDDVDAMVDRVVSELGGIHILVNNAGTTPPNVPTLEQSVEDWDRVVAVILRGSYLCAQRAGQWMASHKTGKIVNISSIAGIGGFPRQTSYGSAKAGVINMTRVLAIEWAPYNINVNSIAPGYTMTPMVEGGVKKGVFAIEDLEKQIPFGRLAEPDDIAKAALFLASDDASYITGVTLPVDGGLLVLGCQGL